MKRRKQETREESLERIRKRHETYDKRCEFVLGSFEIFTPDRDDVTKKRTRTMSTVVHVSRYSDTHSRYNHLFNVDVEYSNNEYYKGAGMRQLKKWLDHHFRAFRKDVMFINAEVITQYDDTKLMRFRILVSPRFSPTPVSGRRIGG